MATEKEKTAGGGIKLTPEEAKQEFNEFLAKQAAAADAELEKFQHLQKYEMVGECLDRMGRPTKVLEIDTDTKGLLGFFLRTGHIFSLQRSREVEPGRPEYSPDEDKLLKYMHFMSNIDLDNEDNLVAIGMNALSGARNHVSDFFMLKLVSTLSNSKVK